MLHLMSFQLHLGCRIFGNVFSYSDVAFGLASTTWLLQIDSMIYLTVQNNRDAELLQFDLSLLCQRETSWLMEFHSDKCIVISVTRKKNPEVKVKF